MGLEGHLCTLSEKRLRLLEEDPELVDEIVSAAGVPGLLCLGAAFGELDFLVSDGGKHPVLRDAITARGGRLLGDDPASPRVLAAARVREVHGALAAISADVLRARFPKLKADPFFGPRLKERPAGGDVDAHVSVLAKVRELYAAASTQSHGMMFCTVTTRG